MVLLLLIHCLLLPQLLGLWFVVHNLHGSVVPGFTMTSLAYPGEERAGYFTLIAFLCRLTVNVLCPFLVVPWVGLPIVIVAFLGHTTCIYFFM